MNKPLFPTIVITLVIAIVFTLAGTILLASLNSEYSSPRLIARYLSPVNIFARSNADYEADVNLLSSETNIPEIAKIQDCPALFETYAAKYGDSLITYLEAKHFNTSFDTRNKMALRLGIVGYNGDLQQNELMLKELIAKERDLTSEDCLTYNKFNEA